MSELAKMETGKVLSLADYEARIYLYKEQIGTGYIGIGRTLIEAKEAGVVPHGEWEAWVTRTTGLESRQAQRCMQAAREIKDGSALAKLEMSKALMLLSSGLEEEEQEALAKTAGEEGQSVRALKAEIAKLKEEKEKLKEEKDAGMDDAREVIKNLKVKLVEESGTAAEIRNEMKRIEAEKNRVELHMREALNAWRKRMEEETGKAYRQGAAEKEKTAREDVRKEYAGKLEFLNGKNHTLEEQVKALQESLEELQKENGAQWDKGFEAANRASAEAMEKATTENLKVLEELKAELEAKGAKLSEGQGRIAELEAELEAAEKREARRAQELAEMRKAKAQGSMDAARGIGGETMGAVDLAQAVRSFIGAAGVLPQMGNLIAGMSAKERESIRAQIETVGKWVADSRKAMGIVMADASIQ